MKPDRPGGDREGQLRWLWKLAFGDEEAFIRHFFETAYRPENSRCILEGGQVAAALYWFDAEFRGQKQAYLYAVATHPDHRGKGLCRRLMEDTHAVLRERGYAAALLTPAEVGLRRMYAGMGYRDCCTVSEFFSTAGEAAALREMDAGEYARLRRQYLPEGGVVQERENLSYLAGFAKFYAGGDFLLAAAREGENLRGLELLGNREAAPGILSALGCETGIFRVPGGEIPFTMWQPLTEGAEKPDYFGLAFD